MEFIFVSEESLTYITYPFLTNERYTHGKKKSLIDYNAILNTSDLETNTTLAINTI